MSAPPISPEEITTRFTYHPPKDGQVAKYTTLRTRAKELAELIVEMCPSSRETSLALTSLEQSIMWANASIARRS
jgi:hypothetical protein